MKTMRAWIACLALFATQAGAVIPENGWWWASNESGRGFNIEVQNNLLFFAAFAYEANGTPAWITSGGSMTSDRDYSGALIKFTGGQCFGCAYVAPTQVAAGNMTLRFTSSQTAILTINGTSINVKRFDFWLNEFAPDAMQGEWSYVIGESGQVFDAERIQYRVKASDSSGQYIGGSRVGTTSSSNPAVVRYDSSRATWIALLDSSTSFYRYFEFNQTGFNRIEGSYWLYAKGGAPAGNGTFVQGYRSGSAAFVTTGSGPASSKALPARDLAVVMDGRDRDMFLTLEREGKVLGTLSREITPESLAQVRELEALLEALRTAE